MNTVAKLSNPTEAAAQISTREYLSFKLGAEEYGIGDVQTGDSTRMLILMDIERLMQSPDMGLTDI